MKHLLVIPDGAADHPHPDLDGRTPLAAAHLMHLRAMAVAGQVGRARTIPQGMAPGSDVGCMSAMGFDPLRYHTGRAAIEAAAMGIKLKNGQVAYRCNLVTVKNGVMKDFAAGHISDDESHELIEALQDSLGGEVTFHPGVMYRHVMVAPAEIGEAACTPPHDIIGSAIAKHLPKGASAKVLKKLMEQSTKVLAEHPVNKERERQRKPAATQIWLWGQGTRSRLPSFKRTYGVSGAVISAVDLVRGLGALTGLEVITVPGATGYYDTNYKAKAEAALVALRTHDFCVVHVEPTDEAGHEGNVDRKVEALQRFDAELLGTIRQRLAGRAWKMLLLPDHSTPCALRRHTDEPVPYLLFDATEPQPGGTFTEEAISHLDPIPAHTLVKQLLS
jgi:2,3-bisphosphoglycerate-independent phosphoglycerate mutase